MLPIYLELAFLLFRICKAYVGDVRRLMQSEHRELLYLRPGTMGSVQAKVGPALSGQERQFEEHPSACCCEQRLDVAGADRVAPIKAIRRAIEYLIVALRRCCHILQVPSRRDLNSRRLP
jgi:hypothetical protein